MIITSSDWNETWGLLLICLFLTSVVLIFGILPRRTNGLFLARTTEQFRADRNNPKYKKERQAGRSMQKVVLRYILPICLVTWLLFLYLSLIN